MSRTPSSKIPACLLTVLVALGSASAASAFDDARAGAIMERFCLGEDFFIVTRTDDHEDAEGCTDADCSLREAVNDANVCPPDHPGEIRLFAETYTLTKTGYAFPIRDDSGESAGSTALPVLGGVILYGNGAIIERAAVEGVNFRIFEVRTGASLAFRDLTVRGGYAFGDGRDVAGAYPVNKGGGVYVMPFGSLFVSHSTLVGNRAYTYGGAIYNEGVTELTATTVRANRADRGGGIYNQESRARLVRSTLVANIARGQGALGGAVMNSGGELIVEGSTLSGNRASAGAGINHLGGSLRLADSTVYANEASDPTSGGGLYLSGNSHVTNVAVARNLPRDCRGNVVGPMFASGGVNLDSDGSCATLSTALRFEITADPVLLPLRYNGGPTQTHLPRAASPLVDAGDTCGATDQRFEPRPRDGNADGTASCDVGAVERVHSKDAFGDKLRSRLTREWERTLWMRGASHRLFVAEVFDGLAN